MIPGVLLAKSNTCPPLNTVLAVNWYMSARATHSVSKGTRGWRSAARGGRRAAERALPRRASVWPTRRMNSAQSAQGAPEEAAGASRRSEGCGGAGGSAAGSRGVTLEAQKRVRRAYHWLGVRQRGEEVNLHVPSKPRRPRAPPAAGRGYAGLTRRRQGTY